MEQELIEASVGDFKDDIPDDGIVFKHKAVNNIADTYGATPLEDRYGRHLWVKTRLCFCENSAKTDCRFHSPQEVGWENCPNELFGKAAKKKGLWLWARNPMYGKPPTELEEALWKAEEEESPTKLVAA